jgi:hypothetical protein
MPRTIEKQLNETLRDAQIALYLSIIAPNDSTSDVLNHLKTANDLYHYLLLDVLVSQDVPTSTVACAITSLQQYINSILMNLEPGYHGADIPLDQIQTWHSVLHHYPTWAANQQLHYFPGIYLDPTLRTHKTNHFQQLENDINQNQLTADSVQTAVLSYLAKLEEVANLNVLNGYIDGTDFANSTYYFIAKSPATKTYYWRSLDMSQRAIKGAPAEHHHKPPRYDAPEPQAWSDWKPANLSISESAIEHTIRPVSFNNRLFVVWAECIFQDPAANALSKPAITGATKEETRTYPLLRLNFCYKKYDESWSAPQTCLQGYCTHDMDLANIQQKINTLATYDRSRSSDSLFIALFIEAENSNSTSRSYVFEKSAQIDKNFNTTLMHSNGEPTPLPNKPDDTAPKHLHTLINLFAYANTTQKKQPFQFRYEKATTHITDVNNSSITVITEDSVYKRSPTISSVLKKNTDITYDPHASALSITSTAPKSFFANDILITTLTLALTVDDNDNDNDNDKNHFMTLTLITPDPGTAPNPIKLLPGSKADIPQDLSSKYKSYALDLPKTLFKLPLFVSDSNAQTPAPWNPSALTLSYINKETLQSLIDASPSPTPTLTGYTTTEANNGSTITVNTFRVAHHMGRTTCQQIILRPKEAKEPTDSFKYEDMVTLGISAPRSSIPKGCRYTLPIPMAGHLHPHWWDKWPASLKSIPVIHGVVWRNASHTGELLGPPVGYELNVVTITLTNNSTSEQRIAPHIASLESQSLGIARFIDFSESTAMHSDKMIASEAEKLRAPIRMNTSFARHLIHRAEASLDALLSWSTQHLQEPPLKKNDHPEPMNFYGAFGRYFVELFLYLPWLVAHRLNRERQYSEAERWLRYVFDPGRRHDDNGSPDYWSAVPLMTSSKTLDQPSYAIMGPQDPHQIALSHPVHFRKALHLLYLDILLNRGDSAYRELTPDGLAEAKLRYVRVQDLLGPRPDVRQVDIWQDITLKELSEQNNSALRTFEQHLVTQKTNLTRIETPGIAPTLCLRPYAPALSVETLDTPQLRLPFNPALISRWEKVESRLHNLRHNLDIVGRPMHLPLFAPPLSPRDVMNSNIQHAAEPGNYRQLNAQIPPYRFSVMFTQAMSAVDTVIQFGASLLSFIERTEQALLQEFQQQHIWDLAKIAIDQQTQALVVDQKSKEALLASKAIVEGRIQFYTQLVDEVVNDGEVTAAALHLQGRIAEASAGAAQVLGEGLKVPPNIVGTSVGGFRLEGGPYALMAGAQTAAAAFHGAGDALDRATQYRRRHQEWTLARDQAQLEVAQIEAQLALYAEQETATRLQLHQTQTALMQAKATYNFLTKSFTNAQLYQWFSSQFSIFYYQVYDTALSLCQTAQMCWRYEMADDATQSFIQPQGWNATYRGLGPGESMKLGLLNMQSAYLMGNDRELEIRKTVSLKHLKRKDQAAGLINKGWADITSELQQGTCSFELTQDMFEDDYKGQHHYLRRIKSISVSLPVTLGPYEDICAILTQTYSKVVMSDAEEPEVKVNLRANQQIALSTGIDDNGLFNLRFEDERYLPFEFTGAISKWQLTFPNPTAQKAMLESLTDIIVHVHYTARAGRGAQ